ncbi:hypothetical protein [Ferrimonas marina]|uniref:Uncharacterized protein n=1 Tax=Ferrimonas marina TaxID=299255 RepID=A0A1M5VC88_9GAMM|nr:hypothetical protein [Ferrimonas marina]SHH72768.1 hypothetical protein SAMN02745129_2700 [Ferrimonas marina]
MKRSLSLFAAAMALALPTQAHYGTLACWFEQDRSEVHCQAGWTDGSSATNYEVRLFDYDDTLIDLARTDNRSRVLFEAPETDEFYLVFDPGHEAPAEVDVVEMRER